MARGRAGKRKWLVPHQRALERQHDECTALLGKPSQLPFARTRITGRQTGCDRNGVEWPPREVRKGLAAVGGYCEGGPAGAERALNSARFVWE